MKNNTLLVLVIAFTLSNCFPNNQSSRDRCKEGTQNKTGKKQDLNFICSSSLFNISKAEERNDTSLKNSALLSCFLAIQDLEKCDKQPNIKFSLSP